MEYIALREDEDPAKNTVKMVRDLFTSQPTMHGMTGQAMSARRVMQIIWNLDFGPIDVLPGI